MGDGGAGGRACRCLSPAVPHARSNSAVLEPRRLQMTQRARTAASPGAGCGGGWHTPLCRALTLLGQPMDPCNHACAGAGVGPGGPELRFGHSQRPVAEEGSVRRAGSAGDTVIGHWIGSRFGDSDSAGGLVPTRIQPATLVGRCHPPVFRDQSRLSSTEFDRNAEGLKAHESSCSCVGASPAPVVRQCSPLRAPPE